jgi:hypothetical protein
MWLKVVWLTEIVEIYAASVAHRAHGAIQITHTVWVLDFYHSRAHIPEHHRRQRASDRLTSIDHHDAIQRPSASGP